MSTSIFINAIALGSLVPAAVLPLRAAAQRDFLFWGALALATGGAGGWAAHLLAGAWQTDLGTALWVSIAATALLYSVISFVSKSAWRLSPILMPYLFAMGSAASTFQGQPKGVSGSVSVFWLDAHILSSVSTYAFLTLAATASAAVFLQERALKRKSPNRLTRMLPAVMESESLAGRLLLIAEIVLGIGLASGMAIQFMTDGRLLHFDHKILLSLIAFVLIGALLIGRRVCGVRGRAAARVVTMSYLLVTLAYPGVKFVTEVLH